ncbi:MAG: hypothetical protein GWO83_00725 [Bacteroidia bacterium]|nr:hypothetical protein [Bacteroidia bacterium]
MSGGRAISTAGALAVGAALALVARFTLPLELEDPFRSTLIALPLIVAALVALGSWAIARDGKPTPQWIVLLEWSILAFLVLLALSRNRLGLVGDPALLDGVIAAGFLLLLGHRTGRILMALRPTLEQEGQNRASSVFFFLPFLVYLAILPWSSSRHAPDGDEPHYLLLTHSLAYDLETDLANNYGRGDSLAFMDRSLGPQEGDPVGPDGEMYSRHNVLLPLTLAPAYRFAGLTGVLVVMAALTAALVWATLNLAMAYHLREPAGTLWSYAILAFTAPLILYSYQVWVEVPAALLTVIALVYIRRMADEESHGWATWLRIGLPVLALPFLKIRFVLLAGSLVILASWYAGGERARRRTAALLAALGGVTVSILLFNRFVFQNPLKYHDIDGLRAYAQSPLTYLKGFLGLFYDCAFGLFAVAPIWLLILPAAVLLWFQHRRLFTDSLLVLSPYLMLLAPRGEWFGGWSPPFRYGIVALPFLALWLIPVLADRQRGGRQFLIAGLAAATVVLTLVWIVEPGWTYNLAHGRSHLLDYLSSALKADTARFFPSSARPRFATWIWPPVSILAACLLWWMPKRSTHSGAILGLCSALLLPALVATGSQKRHTSVIEFEDPWLEPTGGEVHPELWVVYRPRYRGGWTLSAGESVSIPVVPGGSRFDLVVELKEPTPLMGEAVLEIRSGEKKLKRRPIQAEGRWRQIRVADLPWDGDEPLVLAIRRRSRGTDPEILLDRARLEWREGASPSPTALP